MLSSGSFDQASSHNRATHCLQTRDAKRFRPLASPLAALSNHLFTLLGGPGVEGAKLRSAFAWSTVGGDPSDRRRTEVDALTLETFKQPPTVVLFQGAMRVDHLLESPETSAVSTPMSDTFSVNSVQSGMSSLSMGSRPDLADCIILPYTLHFAINEAISDKDEELKLHLMLMGLSTIIHETAHWLGLRLHGFIPDPERKDWISNNSKLDNALCLLGQRPDDLGAIADMLLLGHQYKLLTLADGTQDLVARSIPTIENGGQFGRKPLLPPAKLTHLLGGPCPPVRDVTQFAHVGTDDKPSWGHQDLSTIVSMLSPNAMCHHGSCVRIHR